MSSIIRRNILTSASRLSTTSTTTIPAFRTRTTTRLFSATMGKEGIHNLSSKADFDAAKGQNGSLMVLDCYATWCGPCKAIAPEVSKFSDTFPEVRFYKLDVDEVEDVAGELSVRAMPTFFLFKDGEQVAKVMGANKDALETAIRSNL